MERDHYTFDSTYVEMAPCYTLPLFNDLHCRYLGNGTGTPAGTGTPTRTRTHGYIPPRVLQVSTGKGTPAGTLKLYYIYNLFTNIILIKPRKQAKRLFRGWVVVAGGY